MPGLSVCGAASKGRRLAAPVTGAASLLAVLHCAAGVAEELDLRRRGSLTNGLGGFAESLSARGVDLALVYTGEVARVTGGLEDRYVYLDNVDITLEAQAEPLTGAEGGTFFVYVLGNHGDSASEFAGDAQTVSNIDAPDTWKVYEFWYQQNWSEDRYSLKAGLYDFNSEFDVNETGGLFLGSSHGIGPDIAQTGENGPSIFPTTSLAVRAMLNLDNGTYLQAVALDGVPGDPQRPDGTHIDLDADDGLLLAAEVGYVREPGACGYRKFALGTWRYTAAVQEDAAGVAIAPRENRGVYAIAEGLLVAEGADTAQGLAAYLRYGIADDRVNQFDSYIGGGLVYTGLLPGRDEDQLGLAVARAQNGSRFREQTRMQGTALESAETAIEISYRAQLTPWLAVQPDYQYVVDPGSDPAIDNAHVLMLRFEVVL